MCCYDQTSARPRSAGGAGTRVTGDQGHAYGSLKSVQCATLGCMSFDVFVQKFHDGDSVPLNTTSVATLLDPLITNKGDGFVDIATADGSAVVYGYGHPVASLMFTHSDGDTIWNVIFDTAKASNAVIMAGDAGWFGSDLDLVSDLPDGMEGLFRVVTSGLELLHAIRST